MTKLGGDYSHLDIDYEKDMSIDEDAIDLELFYLPKVEERYIRAVSIAFKNKQILHEELKTKRSELILKANKHPKKCCHKDKPNAGDIEAFYRTDKGYKELKEELIEADDTYNVLNEMKDGIHFTKKGALDNLTQLMNMEYFAGPVMPRDINDERRKWKKKKAINKKIGSGMKRGKKKK